jgi:hypothetical protein
MGDTIKVNPAATRRRTRAHEARPAGDPPDPRPSTPPEPLRGREGWATGAGRGDHEGSQQPALRVDAESAAKPFGRIRLRDGR